MAGPTVSGKKRLFVALGGIAFIFILLIIRLFWIQIIDGKRLSEMAQEQQTQMTKTFEDLESLWDEYDVYERVE